MARLSIPQVAQIVMVAGFPREEVARGAGIAYAESSGNTDSISDNPDGNKNVGLFQIDTATARGVGRNPAMLTDPLYNARTAYLIWKRDGGSWREWATYASGAYETYMNQVPGWMGPKLTGKSNPDPFGSGGAVDKAGKTVASAASGVVDATKGAAAAFTDVVKYLFGSDAGAHYLRIGKVLGGLVLVGLALKQILNIQTPAIIPV